MRLSSRVLGGAVVGLLLSLTSIPSRLSAQQPTEEQVKAILQTRPDLVMQVRQQIASSGLSPDQIRSRLRAAGYGENLLDPYLGPATENAATPGENVLSAVRVLGLSEAAEPAVDTLRNPPGTPRTDLPIAAAPSPIFGADVFRRSGTQFQPSLAGPVDAKYKLGPGDVLVLILTGDVELSHTLEVTREGFIVIPQVGQLFVSGLNLMQVESVLYTRLSRVYSGVRRGEGATTRFQVTVARLRTNQIFVVGDVVRPGSYQISSAGTTLTALYAAGGPSDNGSFRRIEIRRGGKVVDSLDLYDYLLNGNNSHDIRLETGDVVFVPVHATRARISGPVVRPAIYELKAGETLRDLIAASGGFTAEAARRRVQVDRILPPAERQTGGRDRVLLDLAADQFADGVGPSFPLQPGDEVRVFGIAERRRNSVNVRGNVWSEGMVGFTPGMRLGDALRLAGGPKPDVYVGQILVTRLLADSTRIQLHAAFRDSTGALATDLALAEDDDVLVFSRTSFRPARYIAVTGAVKRPGRLRYVDGMTLQDAVLQAEGLSEDALLTEAEIARIPSDRTSGQLATTTRVALDSTYIFDRGPNGEYKGPPGVAGAKSGAPETLLQPYDNVLILRQPDWELQRTVAIAGQVRYPGRYSLRSRTERLTDLIERAGGLSRDAYPLGVEFYRSGDPTVSAQDRTRTGARARVGIDLPRVLEDHAFRDNLILAGGDSIVVPEYNPVIRVVGAVNAPTSVSHVPGQNLDEYVSASGGYSYKADRGRAYVVQPNGKLETVKRRFLLPDSKPKPLAGAIVYVPERDPTLKKDWVAFMGSIAQILVSTVAIIVLAKK